MCELRKRCCIKGLCRRLPIRPAKNASGSRPTRVLSNVAGERHDRSPHRWRDRHLRRAVFPLPFFLSTRRSIASERLFLLLGSGLLLEAASRSKAAPHRAEPLRVWSEPAHNSPAKRARLAPETQGTAEVLPVPSTSLWPG